MADHFRTPLSQLLPLIHELQSSLHLPNSHPTAAHLLLVQQQNQQHAHPQAIVTFHATLDRQILPGGIALGHLWEIAGPPGVGKTQFVHQLSVNASIPKAFGGVQGRTLYIDTEGSVVTERMEQMSKALLRHLHSMQRKQQHKRNLPTHFDLAHILKGILVYRIYDLPTQMALLHSIADIVKQENEQNPSLPIRLIVIDSMAFHFRSDTAAAAGSYHHYGSLPALARQLAHVAQQYHLAVVCVNHMTTKQPSTSGSSVHPTTTTTTPSLGESWAHAVTYRIQLFQDNHNNHKLQLTKAPDRPTTQTASFRIRTEGFREPRSD